MNDNSGVGFVSVHFHYKLRMNDNSGVGFVSVHFHYKFLWMNDNSGVKTRSRSMVYITIHINNIQCHWRVVYLLNLIVSEYCIISVSFNFYHNDTWYNNTCSKNLWMIFGKSLKNKHASRPLDCYFGHIWLKKGLLLVSLWYHFESNSIEERLEAYSPIKNSKDVAVFLWMKYPKL